jgi:predicted DNA-binding mobile mystery protein A
MKNHLLMVRQLDRQLKEWRSLRVKYQPPKTGWVRAIRKALGMTAEQLAKRLGLQRTRIVQLELAETQDAITLRSLRNAAAAMECELIYALVPKDSLENILKTKAFELATEQVNRVSHSMSLEDQALEEDQQKEQILQLAKDLLEGPLKKLWRAK